MWVMGPAAEGRAFQNESVLSVADPFQEFPSPARDFCLPFVMPNQAFSLDTALAWRKEASADSGGGPLGR